MDAESAKYIGAGLATLGMIGAGIGVGTIFGHFLAGATRNPSAAGSQFTNLILGARQPTASPARARSRSRSAGRRAW